MFLRRRRTKDFSDEIEAHIQLEIDRLREQGLGEQAAQAAAYRKFGSPRRARENFYESGHWMWWDHLRYDVRYALRMLRKSPGFTAIAILTIALGIGATTAIFSVVDATLLHPLPFPHPEQLVTVEDDLPGLGARDVGMSVPEWHDFQRSDIFQYLSLVGGGSVNLTGSSQPARILFAAVPPNYFAMLGVNPEFGRSFNPQDTTPGFPLEVLISDGLWKECLRERPAYFGQICAPRQRPVPNHRRDAAQFSRPRPKLGAGKH